LKDLEKLVRLFTSLSKRSEVPSSCRVEPFSGVHALPDVLTCSFCLQDHHTLSSLPPLPEGGYVSECAIISDDSQETSILKSKLVESEKSAGSSEKISELEKVYGSSHTNSTPPTASPDKRKRKRNPDEEDSCNSKLSEPAAEDSTEGQENFDPFTAAGDVSS
jgi:hypothetical protein